MNQEDRWHHSQDFPLLAKNVELILKAHNMVLSCIVTIDDFAVYVPFRFGSAYSKNAIRQLVIDVNIRDNRLSIYKYVTQVAVNFCKFLDDMPVPE